MSFEAACFHAPPPSASRSRSPRAAAIPTRSRWTSTDPREAALLAFLKALFASEGRPPHHLLEEAREVGWTDEELLEAVAHLAVNEFQSLISNAAALPQDQTDPAILPAAA